MRYINRICSIIRFILLHVLIHINIRFDDQERRQLYQHLKYHD